MAGSKKGRTVTRPRTTFHCHWRPRRKLKRVWTERAVARVYCKCIEEGGHRIIIEKEIETRCAIKITEDIRLGVGSLSLAAEAIFENQVTLDVALKAFGVTNAVIAGVIVILGLIRLAGPLRLIATPARTAARLAQIQVSEVIARIQLQMRVNDRIYAELIQRERLLAGIPRP